MPLLGPTDALRSVNRVLVAGVSGSGKSTLCRQIHDRSGLAYVELDSLYHGPNWSVRPTFASDVENFIAQDRWVLEWQYDAALRERLLGRADLVIWLDYPIIVTMERVLWRTLRRSFTHEPLWNGNVEPPLRTILWDPEHIVRWSWNSRRLYPERIRQVLAAYPDLAVLHITRPSQARRALETIVTPLA